MLHQHSFKSQTLHYTGSLVVFPECRIGINALFRGLIMFHSASWKAVGTVYPIMHCTHADSRRAGVEKMTCAASESVISFQRWAHYIVLYTDLPGCWVISDTVRLCRPLLRLFALRRGFNRSLPWPFPSASSAFRFSVCCCSRSSRGLTSCVWLHAALDWGFVWTVQLFCLICWLDIRAQPSYNTRWRV